ncbi:DUF3307 domain-containing protein [Salinisphaera sp. T31B1]|uniref:DUF3307 domain-containing protein n=1 Tax=Salinisphaera sp. T31B1 TaxID=727963 RepID=UPI0033404D96
MLDAPQADVMLETALCLLFAHVLADFVVQTRAMVAAKHRWPVFALHIAIVAVTAGACLGTASASGWAALGVVVLSHATVDSIKTFALNERWTTAAPFRALHIFLLDQTAHVVFAVVAAWLYPQAFVLGAWPKILDADAIRWLLSFYVLAGGFWLTVRVGDLLLVSFMAGFRRLWPAPRLVHNDQSEELPRAGAWIGWLERTLVFLFVLLGQFNAIGFVMAAKSVLRFEYARRPYQSEIVIIGTLASFGWAIVIALVTRAALVELGPGMVRPAGGG